MLTDNLCISPLDYASSGVYLIQQQVTDKQATICARVNLSNGTGELRKVVLRLQVNDGKKTVYETEKEVSIDSSYRCTGRGYRVHTEESASLERYAGSVHVSGGGDFD